MPSNYTPVCLLPLHTTRVLSMFNIMERYCSWLLRFVDASYGLKVLLLNIEGDMDTMVSFCPIHSDRAEDKVFQSGNEIHCAPETLDWIFGKFLGSLDGANETGI